MSTRSSSAARVVCWICILAPLPAQETHPLDAGADWNAKVKAAVESPRYALQRAACNDIARAGDAVVPAIRAYAEHEGKAALPLLLVDALAQGSGDGEATRALLREWAADPEFFWRAQALAGLAQRKSAADAELFAAALRDPSHLYRVAGARGVYALAVAAGKPWDAAKAVLADADPRARAMLALALWETREPAALPALVAALADDRAFLDDFWGRRFAVQSANALARVASTNFGYQGTAALAKNADAIAKFAKWAEVEMPPLLEADGIHDLGGLEVRSCRHGDLFVRWTVDAFHFDLDRGRKAELPADARGKVLEALQRAVAENDEPRRVVGTVVCDYLQLTVREPARQWKLAPQAVPGAVAAFLHGLADELAAAGHAELARELRVRLSQFVTRG